MAKFAQSADEAKRRFALRANEGHWRSHAKRRFPSEVLNLVNDYVIGTKGYWMDKFDLLVIGQFWTKFDHIRPPVCMVNRYDELCFYCYKHETKCRCAARHF
jgi:hypothetical protein